jgi:hypothetical protein
LIYVEPVFLTSSELAAASSLKFDTLSGRPVLGYIVNFLF